MPQTITPFDIKYCSVDGDVCYNLRFKHYFDLIHPYLIDDNLEMAFDLIKGTKGYQISDFLYILKNARSRLLKTKVVINPASIYECVDYDYLVLAEA